MYEKPTKLEKTLDRITRSLAFVFVNIIVVPIFIAGAGSLAIEYLAHANGLIELILAPIFIFPIVAMIYYDFIAIKDAYRKIKLVLWIKSLRTNV